MLIGIDILQYFPSSILSQFGGGACFKMNDKLIPLGNVNNFLCLEQMNEYRCNLDDVICNNNEQTGNNNNNEVDNFISETVVNNILNPVKSYFNPLTYIY